MLTEELLDVVRVELGDALVTYQERPVRLTGGFFTENHAFLLAGAPPPWNGPLVVRLFPSAAPPDLARREAAVQRVLSAQGYPAAPVVMFDDSARLHGKRFFVMERLPGAALMAGNRMRELAGSAWRMYRQLPDVTATVQASLHRVDASPLLAELDDLDVGLDRWFAMLGEQVHAGAEGLRAGLDWLVDHQPPKSASPSICHGDLWGGNILTERGRVTGVLDWSTVTVAEPALDVGFTAMSLCLAPIEAPAFIQRSAARVGVSVSARYVRTYQRLTGADLTAQPYYEALRCATELSWVAAYRMAEASGEPHEVPRLSWDSIPDQMIAYFRARTGVTLSVPPSTPR